MSATIQKPLDRRTIAQQGIISLCSDGKWWTIASLSLQGFSFEVPVKMAGEIDFEPSVSDFKFIQYLFNRSTYKFFILMHRIALFNIDSVTGYSNQILI